nr:hypothetical protein [Rhodoferax sp.]
MAGLDLLKGEETIAHLLIFTLMLTGSNSNAPGSWLIQMGALPVAVP